MVVLVFDIDGVLIDDTNSYYEAIRKTFSFYIEYFFQKRVNPFFVTDQVIFALKKKGGFNNDFDVTAALLCYYVSLCNGALKQEKKWDFFSFLKKHSFLNLSSFFQEIVAENKKLMHFFVHEDGQHRVNKNSDLIRIFQEIYLGEDLFKKIYGQPVRFLKTNGSIHNEKSLVTHSYLKHLSSLCDAFAIATGRERGEAEYSLKKHFKDISFDCVITASSLSLDRQKPHPESLLNIDAFFHQKSIQRSYFFIGDQMDDMDMVFSAQKTMDVMPIAFLRKERTFSKEEFLQRGVRYIISKHSEIESILKKKENFCG